MNTTFFSHLPGLIRRRLVPLLGALVLCLSTAAWGQQKEAKKEVSEKVSAAMGGPIKAAKDAQNWPEVIRQLDALLVSAPADSYDRAVLTVDKAQTIFQTKDVSKAIEPLEQALELSDKFHYFDNSTTLTMLLSLAQLYGQEAQATKQPDEQRRLFSKAYAYVRRWLDQSHEANPDLQQFAATILLQQAMLNPDKVDLGLVKQAQIETEKGLRMSVKPKEQFYVLLLTTLQQQGDYKRSAEILELLVKMAPNNKSYWSTLAQTYLQLEENVRAIITIERAQQYGAMNGPKENYTLVGIYYNIQQYDRAIELLQTGLRNGTIDNDIGNWTLLAAAFQQLHKEPQAIAALKEGSKRFPKSGALDLQIGQLYYQIDKTPEAYDYIKRALAKGIDKPASSYLLLAYFAFELKKLDEAVDAAGKALKADPKSKDAQRMLEQFKEAVKERDAQKNQSA